MVDKPTVVIEDLDAVIFDLDGVITKTASVHSSAWTKLFNDYLQMKADDGGDPFRAFQETDYLAYVDGKPRYDGVQSFLLSRGIDLPWGDASDSPEMETVCGLGNRKNDYFLDHVRTQGVEPYDSTVDLVWDLHAHGIEAALISSSRNVMAVLEGAGLTQLFEVIIDGNVAAEIGIPGKPDPAVFLEAAQRVGAIPEQSAIVEDAQSGVQAGSAGGFRVVIGVNRGDQAEELAANGATVVVDDLEEVRVASGDRRVPLPSALDSFAAIEERLGVAAPAFFFDYDGVLTPIVAHPDLATLSDEMRSRLEHLAAVATVAVVSGRDVADVRGKVAVDGIYYAGSHGLDIITPEGEAPGDADLGDFGSYLPQLAAAHADLEKGLAGIEGAWVERKRFALAVHYRQVADADYEAVEQAVAAVAPDYPQLRMMAGKKIFELRPDVDWDKGKALLWLMERMGLDRPNIVPFYFGDDTTDEDAFKAIRQRGVTVKVGPATVPSTARYFLPDPDAVGDFLARMADR